MSLSCYWLRVQLEISILSIPQLVVTNLHRQLQFPISISRYFGRNPLQVNSLKLLISLLPTVIRVVRFTQITRSLSLSRSSNHFQVFGFSHSHSSEQSQLHLSRPQVHSFECSSDYYYCCCSRDSHRFTSLQVSFSNCYSLSKHLYLFFFIFHNKKI